MFYASVRVEKLPCLTRPQPVVIVVAAGCFERDARAA